MDPGSLLFWLLAEMEMYEMGPDSRPNTKSANPDLVRGDLRANGIGMPPGMAVKVKRTVNYIVLKSIFLDCAKLQAASYLSLKTIRSSWPQHTDLDCRKISKLAFYGRNI